MEGISCVYKLELSIFEVGFPLSKAQCMVGILSTSPLHVAVDPVFRMGGFRAAGDFPTAYSWMNG